MFNKSNIGDIVTHLGVLLQVGKIVDFIDGKDFPIIVEFIGDEIAGTQVQRKFNSSGDLQFSKNTNVLKKLESPYLIQEAIQRNIATMSESEGVDKYLEFKYMGAAEYEWGAKKNSLTRIRENAAEYSSYIFRLKNNSSNKKEKPVMISILCKTKEKIKIEHHILELAKGNVILKENINFHNRLSGFNSRWSTNKQFDKEDFYWDLKNDFMFWFTNDGSWSKHFLYAVDPKLSWR